MESAATHGSSDDLPGSASSMWERPETVAWFAARPPDARFVEPRHPTEVAQATTVRGHRLVLNDHVRRARAVPSARAIEEIR